MGPVGVLRASWGQVNSPHSFPPGATSLIILQGFNALKERLNRYHVIHHAAGDSDFFIGLALVDSFRPQYLRLDFSERTFDKSGGY